MFTQDYLGIAQYISKHPILNEPEKNKVKYLESLYWVYLRFSENDVYATALMKVYYDTLVNDPTVSDKVDLCNPGLMDFAATRFKWFKFYTYRYLFLIDCLFINSFLDDTLSQTILNELLTHSHKRFHKNLVHLCDVLLEHTTDDKFVERNHLVLLVESWLSNREFFTREKKTILVTANMGAGKSTLINSLVGKRINKTKQETCTAKIHYIFDKSFEDDFSYELDHLLDLNADHDTLMIDNEMNYTNDIAVGTYFRTQRKIKCRLCIVDTPGVNSSRYPEHRAMTESAIKKGSFDKLIYVANCESIGTVDDKNHLQFISRYVDNTKIIFALNKLDSFKQSDDSVKESISSFRNELREHGFQNPVICPISAYAAWLAKKSLFGDGLKEDEECDIQHYMRKFQKTEFDFESYYESNNESGHDYQCTGTDTEKNKKYIELLRKTGMLSFESIILK